MSLAGAAAATMAATASTLPSPLQHTVVKPVSMTLILGLFTLALLASLSAGEELTAAWETPPALETFSSYEDMQRYFDHRNQRRLRHLENPLEDSYIEAYNQHNEHEELRVKRSAAEHQPALIPFEMADAVEPSDEVKDLIRQYKSRELQQNKKYMETVPPANSRNLESLGKPIVKRAPDNNIRKPKSLGKHLARPKRSMQHQQPPNFKVKYIPFEVSDAREPDAHTKFFIKRMRALEIERIATELPLTNPSSEANMDPSESISTTTKKPYLKRSKYTKQWKPKRVRREASAPEMIKFEISDAKDPDPSLKTFMQTKETRESKDLKLESTPAAKTVEPTDSASSDESAQSTKKVFVFKEAPTKVKKSIAAIPHDVQNIISHLMKGGGGGGGGKAYLKYIPAQQMDYNNLKVAYPIAKGGGAIYGHGGGGGGGVAYGKYAHAVPVKFVYHPVAVGAIGGHGGGYAGGGGGGGHEGGGGGVAVAVPVKYVAVGGGEAGYGGGEGYAGGEAGGYAGGEGGGYAGGAGGHGGGYGGGGYAGGHGGGYAGGHGGGYAGGHGGGYAAGGGGGYEAAGVAVKYVAAVGGEGGHGGGYGGGGGYEAGAEAGGGGGGHAGGYASGEEVAAGNEGGGYGGGKDGGGGGGGHGLVYAAAVAEGGYGGGGGEAEGGAHGGGYAAAGGVHGGGYANYGGGGGHGGGGGGVAYVAAHAPVAAAIVHPIVVAEPGGGQKAAAYGAGYAEAGGAAKNAGNEAIKAIPAPQFKGETKYSVVPTVEQYAKTATQDFQLKLYSPESLIAKAQLEAKDKAQAIVEEGQKAVAAAYDLAAGKGGGGYGGGKGGAGGYGGGKGGGGEGGFGFKVGAGYGGGEAAYGGGKGGGGYGGEELALAGGKGGGGYAGGEGGYGGGKGGAGYGGGEEGFGGGKGGAGYGGGEGGFGGGKGGAGYGGGEGGYGGGKGGAGYGGGDGGYGGGKGGGGYGGGGEVAYGGGKGGGGYGGGGEVAYGGGKGGGGYGGAEVVYGGAGKGGAGYAGGYGGGEGGYGGDKAGAGYGGGEGGYGGGKAGAGYGGGGGGAGGPVIKIEYHAPAESFKGNYKDIPEFQQLSSLVGKSPEDQIHGLTYLLAKEMQNRLHLQRQHNFGGGGGGKGAGGFGGGKGIGGGGGGYGGGGEGAEARPQDNKAPVLFEPQEAAALGGGEGGKGAGGGGGGGFYQPIVGKYIGMAKSKQYIPVIEQAAVEELKGGGGGGGGGAGAKGGLGGGGGGLGGKLAYSGYGLSPNYKGLGGLKGGAGGLGAKGAAAVGAEGYNANTYQEAAAKLQSYASKYAFGYRIRDFNTGNDFGHKQNRDLNGVTRGQYHILLPDGRIQNVIYHADDTGFHADVSFESGR